MISKSILKTLAYSDVFDYPLKSDEIWRFLIHNKKISKKSIAETLASQMLSGNMVTLVKGFYCFSDRIKIIKTRMRREKESNNKLQLAKKIISHLSLIPTVYFIGITGALSMKNSEEDDDIDLFVITKKNTLWTTRLLLLFLLEILGRRRRRFDKNVQDKICLNFLIDETAIEFPKKRQDLYNAHEIVQMTPVFERSGVYGKFIDANSWIRKFLPNSLDTKILRDKDTKKSKKNAPNILISQFLNILEFLAKKFQFWYIKRHKTKETIKNNFLAFHLLDYKNNILGAYEKRFKKYAKI